MLTIFVQLTKKLDIITLVFATTLLLVPLIGKSVSTIPLTCSLSGITTAEKILFHVDDRSFSRNTSGEKPLKTRQVFLTAYTSEEAQTDNTPFITASNTKVRDGVVATNFLPFGTKITIKGFGAKIFFVEDRMHPRFQNYVDIWMDSTKAALDFGVQKAEITILE